MADDLPPATELAAKAHHPYPGESAAYTRARTALIAEEVELRRHLERVAAQRRALPEAPVVTKDYSFEGKAGPHLRRPVRGARYARHLLLHVRPRARAAVPDVHAVRRGARGQRQRPAPEDRPRGDRALAGRAAIRFRQGARLAGSAPVQRPDRGLRPRPQRLARRRRLAILRRVHA